MNEVIFLSISSFVAACCSGTAFRVQYAGWLGEFAWPQKYMHCLPCCMLSTEHMGSPQALGSCGCSCTICASVLVGRHLEDAMRGLPHHYAAALSARFVGVCGQVNVMALVQPLRLDVGKVILYSHTLLLCCTERLGSPVRARPLYDFSVPSCHAIQALDKPLCAQRFA